MSNTIQHSYVYALRGPTWSSVGRKVEKPGVKDPKRQQLLEAALKVLADGRPRSAQGLSLTLAANGHGPVDAGLLGSVLTVEGAREVSYDRVQRTYWITGCVAQGAGSRNATTLENPVARPQLPPTRTLADWASALKLRAWQQRALTHWAAARHRSVVEAVTGTGKTRVGIAAAAWATSQGTKALVLVPTVDLQRQWQEEVRRLLPGIRVGLCGGGSHHGFDRHDIVLATVQSCYERPERIAVRGGLLIADECHHYGSEQWSRALHKDFRYRLGLTATYERTDTGVEDYLQPYFGDPCYRLHYREALDDGVIAHFKVAFLGVPFSPAEQAAYDQYDAAARGLSAKLIFDFGVTKEPFGSFMREVTTLAEHGDEAGKIARRYLNAFSQRRQILAGASAKLRLLSMLTGAVERAQGTLVFTQTQAATEAAAARFQAEGVATGMLHAKMARDERAETLDKFGAGETLVIAAPKLLDEGIDVPAADLAIVLAASQTRRQMIQRMGRVLRKKEDGRLARVVIMYVRGTSEDPALGAHEFFLDLIDRVATDKRAFGPHDKPSALCAYLNDWAPPAAAAPR